MTSSWDAFGIVYSRLPPMVAAKAKAAADEVRCLMTSQPSPVLQIGKILYAVEEMLEPFDISPFRSNFAAWWKYEFHSMPCLGMRYIFACDAYRQDCTTLSGPVNLEMYRLVCTRLEQNQDSTVVFKVTTFGESSHEVARMIGEEIRFAEERAPRTRWVFLGTTTICPAGVTLMSFFPRPRRYLMRGTRLSIQGHTLRDATIAGGSLPTCRENTVKLLRKIERLAHIEEMCFKNLIERSEVTLDEIRERAANNWLLDAEEAKDRGLIEFVL